jgi:hypothetical protein
MIQFLIQKKLIVVGLFLLLAGILLTRPVLADVHVFWVFKNQLPPILESPGITSNTYDYHTCNLVAPKGTGRGQ